jgi:hypothetical protein
MSTIPLSKVFVLALHTYQLALWSIGDGSILSHTILICDKSYRPFSHSFSHFRKQHAAYFALSL